MTTTSPVSFVSHALPHAPHNHYPTAGQTPPPSTQPPSTSPGSNSANGPPPSPGPAATVTFTPAAQAAAQTLPTSPSTETPMSLSPGASAYDANGVPSAPHEMEGSQINLRG